MLLWVYWAHLHQNIRNSQTSWKGQTINDPTFFPISSSYFYFVCLLEIVNMLMLKENKLFFFSYCGTTSHSSIFGKLSPKSNRGFICDWIRVKPLCKSIIMKKEALLRFTIVSFLRPPLPKSLVWSDWSALAGLRFHNLAEVLRAVCEYGRYAFLLGLKDFWRMLQLD